MKGYMMRWPVVVFFDWGGGGHSKGREVGDEGGSGSEGREAGVWDPMSTPTSMWCNYLEWSFWNGPWQQVLVSEPDAPTHFDFMNKNNI